MHLLVPLEMRRRPERLIAAVSGARKLLCILGQVRTEVSGEMGRAEISLAAVWTGMGSLRWVSALCYRKHSQISHLASMGQLVLCQPGRLGVRLVAPIETAFESPFRPTRGPGWHWGL
jgi:hypothetical protein